jgi:uncharacterized protein
LSDKFTAPTWLPGGQLQTLYAYAATRNPVVAYRRERWDTPDGDFVDVDWIDGAPSAPLVVLFHGLEGSSHSPYARHLMSVLLQKNWHGAVVHFRGCSGELNRMPRAYHSGDSAEIDWILRRIKSRFDGSPLYAAGVSLGGNALLKWLGEQQDDATKILCAAAAVSAPVDLMAAGTALGGGFNLVYAWHFLSTLKRKSHAKLQQYPGLFDAELMQRSRTLREFDNIVTAPLHGFKNTDDYWSRASSKPLLRHISVPTLILNARNDPFLPAAALPAAHDVSDAVTCEFPSGGGHVGFVSGRFPGHIEWLPQRLLDFFTRHSP